MTKKSTPLFIFICHKLQTGDGTGVGKTREIAALFWELYVGMKVKKAVWLSTSSELSYGAIQELDFIAKLIGTRTTLYVRVKGKILEFQIGNSDDNHDENDDDTEEEEEEQEEEEEDSQDGVEFNDADGGILFATYSSMANPDIDDFLVDNDFDGLVSGQTIIRILERKKNVKQDSFVQCYRSYSTNVIWPKDTTLGGQPWLMVVEGKGP